MATEGGPESSCKNFPERVVAGRAAAPRRPVRIRIFPGGSGFCPSCRNASPRRFSIGRSRARRRCGLAIGNRARQPPPTP